MRTRNVILLGLAGISRAITLHAADDDPAMMMGEAAKLDPKQVEFFEKKVQPIFKETCYKCHSLSENKSKGGLTLDTKEGLAKGGKNGAIVKAGDPDKSPLVVAVSYKDPDLQMPPKGEKLSAQQIADLTAWVKMGALDPRKAASAAVATKLSGLTDKARHHWAYQPVKKPAVPTTFKNRGWLANEVFPAGQFNPVDAFVLQKIEEKGMTPSPPAEKETLLRRATYDLTGLPPTPQEVDAFKADSSPTAFATVIDRLLASPHYGERWGRFWLDSARYADTIGGDGNNNMGDYRYPYAWTYRDWVIKSLNSDMPYDKFITQQLAADLIPKNNPENLAALGFLTVGERFGNNNDVINDRIDVVSKGFLAMTVTCSRCHDHMFDPIPTKDYYAMHGIFANIMEPADKPLISKPETVALTADFEKKMAGLEQENRDKYYKVLGEYSTMFWPKAASYIKAAHRNRGMANAEELLAAQKLILEEKLEQDIINDLRGDLNGNAAVFGPLKRFVDGGDSWKAIASEIAANKGNKYNPIVAAAFSSSAPETFEDVANIYGKVFSQVGEKGREYLQAAATAKAEPVPGFDAAMVELITTPFKIEVAGKMTTDGLRYASNAWPQQMRGKAGFVFGKINNLLLTHEGAPKRAMVVADKPNPQDTAVMLRGQADVRGDVVPRSFLEVLSPGGKRMPFRQGSGRLELAQAIAAKSNPLTARVIVNRVWMHHFGEAFVRTPDDLGTQSEAPTHPELLDYLSSYFMEQGWSFKKLHKLIMLSKVYQESSYNVPAHATVDPENRYLWRANVRRLDFEAMRDSLLVYSGKLDRTVVGQPVNLADEPYSYRRSVYGFIDRGNVPELMSHFDFSDPDMPNSKRTTTVVPQQALYLMNSPMAADVARSVLTHPTVLKAENTAGARINAIYKILFQRSPKGADRATGRTAEVELALKFLGEEKRQEPQMVEANKALAERSTKLAKERYEQNVNRGNDTMGSIQNEGKIVERKPLDAWETYVQALLLSNEAAYVN